MRIKKLVRFFLKTVNNYELPEIIKPKPLNISSTDKILVLSPHADDETIGCGGLLSLYGKQIDIILLTDGALAGKTKTDKERIMLSREKEFKNVMNYFGIKNYSFMRAQDGSLIEAYDTFKKIDFSSYDYVFMPHKYDSHKDHIVPQAFFKRIKKENKKIKALPVYYEVWGAMHNGTNFLDITSVTEKKREAIKLYPSQSNIDYANRILALNHYRGIRHNIEYAEYYRIEK